MKRERVICRPIKGWESRGDSKRKKKGRRVRSKRREIGMLGKAKGQKRSVLSTDKPGRCSDEGKKEEKKEHLAASRKQLLKLKKGRILKLRGGKDKKLRGIFQGTGQKKRNFCNTDWWGWGQERHKKGGGLGGLHGTKIPPRNAQKRNRTTKKPQPG